MSHASQLPEPQPATGYTHDVTFQRNRVVKRFRSARHGEPIREWRALQLLKRYAPDLAPGPISAELDKVPSTVMMTRLPGRALAGAPTTEEEASLIIGAVLRLHAAVPTHQVADIEYSISHARIEIPKLQRWAKRAKVPGTACMNASKDLQVICALHLVLSWLRTSEPERLMNEDGLLCFGQSDPNMRNFIRDGDVMRIVDFEDSGRTDTATELADLVEHITMRDTPEGVWAAALAAHAPPAFSERFLMARRMKASYWFLRSLAKADSPGAYAEQHRCAARVHALMS
ncbi:aminoglycoside phosphotransferase family protein [Streptomyces albidoflavus]